MTELIMFDIHMECNFRTIYYKEIRPKGSLVIIIAQHPRIKFSYIATYARSTNKIPDNTQKGYICAQILRFFARGFTNNPINTTKLMN